MKRKLVDVLVMAKAIEILEAAEPKMELTPKGTYRYHRARAAIFAHAETFRASVRDLYAKGPQTPEAFYAAQQTAVDAVDGEEIELQLPPPVPSEWVVSFPPMGPGEHEAMMKLTDTLFGETDGEGKGP